MSEARRSKVLKLFLAILSTVFVFCMAAFVCAPAVYAEGEFSSVGDRYFHTDTEGATVESFLNKAPNMNSEYRGIMTEMTVPEGTTEASMMFNAVVNPFATGVKFILAYDYNESGKAVADMVVTTFTALSDPDKQVSIVQVNRGNRTWVTVALTDDVYFSEGFAYIGDTNSPTIGRMDNGNYQQEGYTVWVSGENSWGAIYGGEFQWFITENGELKMNDSTVITELKSEDWLAKSKANLAGSEYESRYTAEYVQSVLDTFTSDGGALLTVDYYGLTGTRAALNIRGINDQWIGDEGNVPINISAVTTGYSLPVTDTLYVGQTYKPSDLFKRYSIYRDEAGTDLSYTTGFRGTDVWAGEGGVWFDFGYNRTTMDAEFSLTEPGEYKCIVNTADAEEFAGPGRYWSTEQIFTFKVEYPIEATFSVNGEVTESIGVAAAGEITLPEAAEMDGAVFLGWLANGSLYGAGAKYTLSQDTAFQAAFIEFTYDGTASVRLGEPRGIRFIAQFDKATADVLPTLNDVSYSLGMLITSEGSSKSVDIECDSEKIYSDGDYYKFNAALVNIREENLTRVYHAQPYMKITYSDGTTATINAAVEDTSGRSYAGVITAAYNDVQEEAGGEYQTEVIWNGQTRYAKCSAETYALIAELYESLPTQE